ncbi:hypothetical protein HTZ84_09480 [Haloterrigena sp. SYSU A558-1]|uniref:Uncharacterized protein n=1 Tax=Haloterrigena gelatinilytica TaxID=2741724 RepID=A0ABX2L9W2_9EURY|nr:hypothetical protein [Haloterrigena gelatinilytica]NUC72536.1 hypothetical protein [Haloterrigena gelatinilytica]
MDIGLNSNFDIELDHRNDLPVVRGREAFEQRLRLRLTAYYTELIGQNLDVNIAPLLKLEAEQVANDIEEIDSLAKILITPNPDTPNSLDVRIIYATGEDFFTTLSE